MIPVTKPFLPPQAEYEELLKGIWKRNWLTNNGPLLNELELELRKITGVKYGLFLGNGTIALQLAIRSLNLKGEILTTPFSYIATTTSILWEGCKPVFVDIHPYTYNIDPELIESKISEHTTGILATHCFGNPCEIEVIESIANKHNLKVIYDAAHGFGTTYKERSIFSYGDISTTSFHATKLFHTIEGGGIFTKNHQIYEKVSYMRNFGHAGPEEFQGLGINGKNSEFHAAMGLTNLKYFPSILKSRKDQYNLYKFQLQQYPIQFQSLLEESGYNFSYFPALFQNEETMHKVKKALENKGIIARRYFYPSLNSLSYLENKFDCPVSEDVACRILCLPLFFELDENEQRLICKIISGVVNNR